MKEFYGRHANDLDFVMIGIVRDDFTPEVRRYVRREHMGWVIALDPGSEAALDFGTRGQPETFAIALLDSLTPGHPRLLRSLRSP